MRALNRKHKPKHWTKPKWKTGALPTSVIINYFLVSRGMKSRSKPISFIKKLFDVFDRQLKYKFLAKSRKKEKRNVKNMKRINGDWTLGE